MGKEKKTADKKQPRKTYEKPKLDKVVLVPDDAVLTICKAPGACPGNVQKPSHS